MQTDVSLKPYNTFSFETRAAFFSQVFDENDILSVLSFAKEQGLPVIPLGEGSNVVLVGDMLSAVVMRVSLSGMTVLKECDDKVSLRIAAGENWHKLVCHTVRNGWFGLENLAFIPGTVGAAPVQNIGAYGVEVKDFIDAVHTICLTTHTRKIFSNKDCRFSYRDSIFKQALRDQMIITAVDLTLSKRAKSTTAYPALAKVLREQGKEQATPQQVLEAVVKLRKERLPIPDVTPNAGSFFHNPIVDANKARALLLDDPNMPQYQAGDKIKLAAAYLIEQCGYKGFLQGGVGVHPNHALVLINPDGGNGHALLDLADRIQKAVTARYGVALSIEPRIYRGSS